MLAIDFLISHRTANEGTKEKHKSPDSSEMKIIVAREKLIRTLILRLPDTSGNEPQDRSHHEKRLIAENDSIPDFTS